MTKELILKLLPIAAMLHPSNWEKERKGYPQLWWVVGKFKHLNFWRGLCSKLTGHEISKTEWGYGGGKYADCNCRWCNAHLSIPLKESPMPDKVKLGVSLMGELIQESDGWAQ